MRHLLVALDGSPLAETVLPFVETLAPALGSRVTLLHVVSVPDDVPAGSIAETVRRATTLAERYLADQRSRLVAAGIGCDATVLSGDAAREIVAHAERTGCDVVALATHGRSGLQRWAHGSVADRVLRTATVPLLVVRPDEGWTAAPRAVQRLVVPLDGSAASETALGAAAALAVRLGVPVALARYVEPVLDFAPGPDGGGYLDVQRIMDTLIGTARAELERHAAALRSRGITVELDVDVAPAATGIATDVRRHPGSLIVMSTRGRSGWQRLLLGSVARRVVETAPAPILLCPPPRGAATA